MKQCCSLSICWMFLSRPGPVCPYRDGWLTQGSQPSQSSLETGQSRAQHMPALPPEIKSVAPAIQRTLTSTLGGTGHPTPLLPGLRQVPALIFPNFPKGRLTWTIFDMNSNTSNKLMSYFHCVLPLCQVLNCAKLFTCTISLKNIFCILT